MPPGPYKQPVSVLVVVHTAALDVLLLERVVPAGFWQSVTGSLEPGETPLQAALRELAEETGIEAARDDLLDWRRTNRFEIRPDWRARYAPGVTHNTEHVFSLSLARPHSVKLAPTEHRAQLWLPYREAAARSSSWTNRDAILQLPELVARRSAAPG